MSGCSLAYAQQQLKTLSKGIRTARKALNKGEEEEEVDEEDYYEQERVSPPPSLPEPSSNILRP